MTNITTAEILAALRAQHVAIDKLMARLIVAEPGFYPTQSGDIWDAVQQGFHLIELLETKGTIQ